MLTAGANYASGLVLHRLQAGALTAVVMVAHHPHAAVAPIVTAVEDLGRVAVILLVVRDHLAVSVLVALSFVKTTIAVATVMPLVRGSAAAARFLPMVMTASLARVCFLCVCVTLCALANYTQESPPHHEDDLDTAADLAE